MLGEHRFESGIVEINYAEGPRNGPPIVILHGGAGHWRGGVALARRLADRWHVYAPDFRGHGRSGRVPGHYALADYALDTADFLRHVVGEPAVLYGHSLGGEVAIVVAALHPGLVRAVINADAPLSVDNHPTEEEAHRQMNVLWRDLAGRPTGEIIEALKEMHVVVPGSVAPLPARVVCGEQNPWYDYQATSLHQLDPGVLAAVLEGAAAMLAGYDPELLLPAITCPVLLLQADPAKGGALRDEEVERATRLLSQASHVRLAGIGHDLHGPPNQAPAVFEAVTPFLEMVRGRVFTPTAPPRSRWPE